MLTKNADLFDVGVSVAPVMDFRLYDSIYTERSMGLPKDNIKAGYDLHLRSFELCIDLEWKACCSYIGDDNVRLQEHHLLVEEFVAMISKLYYYPNRPHGMSSSNVTKNLYKNDHLF